MNSKDGGTMIDAYVGKYVTTTIKNDHFIKIPIVFNLDEDTYKQIIEENVQRGVSIHVQKHPDTMELYIHPDQSMILYGKISCTSDIDLTTAICSEGMIILDERFSLGGLIMNPIYTQSSGIDNDGIVKLSIYNASGNVYTLRNGDIIAMKLINR